MNGAGEAASKLNGNEQWPFVEASRHGVREVGRIRIREAGIPDDLLTVRELFEEYVGTLGVNLDFQG
jgi:hypothetical protein